MAHSDPLPLPRNTMPAWARMDADALRLLVDSTEDYAIFMLDPQGNICSWNPGAQRIKGYTHDEIIGKHFSTFYTDEANARRWPEFELQEAARLGRFEDEGWRVRKDGTMFWALVVITALRTEEGVLRGFAKVTRDMTQRKVHEEHIVRLQVELERRVVELDAANRELAQRNAENESFVYSVSHDVRAPLVNLQGFSRELAISSAAVMALLSRPDVPEHVRREAGRLLSGDVAESIGFIQNAVRHLGGIIDGLLRLSRVGRVEYQMKDIDTGALVADVLAAMRSSVQASGATVRVGTLPRVVADRAALEQVFANLIGNALKSFAPDRTGVLEIDATGGDPPVFSVRDNGVGIPPEYRSKIFQVFQHVHGAATRGEGMGLAIVRRIVERHGGQIWFDSIRGEGTVFHFTLGTAPHADTRPEPA